MHYLLAFTLCTSAVVVDLKAFGKDAIRVRVAPSGATITNPLYNALLDTAAPGGEAHELSNGNIKVVADSNGVVTVTRISDNTTLLEGTAVTFSAPTNGSRAGTTKVTATFKGYTQRIYGLGEHRTFRVNQFPYSKVFADSLFYPDSNGADVSIPWYCSDKGYGFVWNSPSLGMVNITENVTQWVADATRNLDFWVVTTSGNPADATAAGRSFFAELMEKYVDAVGHSLPLPFWASGFIQSKDRYRNQTQVLDIARGYVTRGLPISMIVIDWFHWKEMGDWSFNPACFPDPQAMVDELRGMGIELMVTLWPYVGMNVSANWDEYLQNKYLGVSQATGMPENFWQDHTVAGNSVVDATYDKAMEATGGHWYEGYGKYGIKAIWMDESEPDHTLYISGGQWDFHAGSDSEMLPAWVRYWSDGFRKALEEKAGRKPGDFFILSRNAWFGTWANGAALWSGDISSTWGDLTNAVTVGQGVMMSGVSLWTTDIGGYVYGNPESPDFQQLIVRWFQFGAFCPLFRTHGHRDGGPPADQCWMTNGDNEVWNLAKDQAHYDAIVAVMRLREDLRDYVMRLNNETVHTGMPMMRPMFLQFPNDTECQTSEAEKQFMLGPDWLVSPVTAANATSWKVYVPPLPPTHEWVYWWTQTVQQQTGWTTFEIRSIADFPLYFRRPVGTPPTKV